MTQASSIRSIHTFNDTDSSWTSLLVFAQAVRKFQKGVKKEETMSNMEKIQNKITDLKLEGTRRHTPSHVEDRLFDMFRTADGNSVNITKFLTALTNTGLRQTDPRLREMKKNLMKVQEKMIGNYSAADGLCLDNVSFKGIIMENIEIINRAFSNDFVIPDFRSFCTHIEDMYYICKKNENGKPASYIPQLARYNSEYWGVSVCTIDGQRFSLGDVNDPFTLQSTSKPINYAVALGEKGPDFVHQLVGQEPSGRRFNELVLDNNFKPHNPMINSGAIMVSSLIQPELSLADRFDHVFHIYKRLCGGEYMGFNNAVFLSERECADRNYALAYFMRENKCFSRKTNIHEVLDFYFQLCSLEATCESASVIAATLANGGICPITGDSILDCEAVRNTLCLMHSCGMYDYSGQFAFKVGLPAKSGVSGAILLVVPNVMGICLWSPHLDNNSNSCRGVQFCIDLVANFNFHHFDSLKQNNDKLDPRRAFYESKAQQVVSLLFSAAAGDITAIRRHRLAGIDMAAPDYDGRTALHLAAAEGHVEIVQFLLEKCDVLPNPKDRWNSTPLHDAHFSGHQAVVEVLLKAYKEKGIVPESRSVSSVLAAHQNGINGVQKILEKNLENIKQGSVK